MEAKEEIKDRKEEVHKKEVKDNKE